MKLSLSKPWSSSRVALCSFLISALGGDEWSDSRLIGPLRELKSVPIEKEVVWTPGPFWTFGKLKIHCCYRDLNPGMFSPSLVTAVTKISQFQNWLCTALKTLYHPYCVLYRHWFGDVESFITKKHFKKQTAFKQLVTVFPVIPHLSLYVL